MRSLGARLTLAASLVLVAFLGLTGFALERAFRDAGLAAVEDRLMGQVYVLLAAADVDDEGYLGMPLALPDGRLGAPGSGHYARVVDGAGRVLWRSPSSLGLAIPFPDPAADGVGAFAPVDAAGGAPLYALGFGVRWELEAGASRRFVFQVAESRDILAAQMGRFRRSLWGWLGAAAVALLLAQGLVLRYGLAPLRRVAAELQDIEAGSRRALSTDYPRELESLTGRINAFIASGRGRLERSRNALAELAHSLKTPLAVLRSLLDADIAGDRPRHTLDAQTARMQRTIDYQLQRAATSGPAPMAPPVAVAPLVARLEEALLKVYADKHLTLERDIADGIGFRGDEGDLMEVLGNLLDNACKWGRRRVRIQVRPGEGGRGVRVDVHDDGPGIPPERREAVLARGVRADPDTPGHGIGLAVVRDVVDAYGGGIRIAASDLGGARVTVSFSVDGER